MTHGHAHSRQKDFRYLEPTRKPYERNASAKADHELVRRREVILACGVTRPSLALLVTSEFPKARSPLAYVRVRRIRRQAAPIPIHGNARRSCRMRIQSAQIYPDNASRHRGWSHPLRVGSYNGPVTSGTTLCGCRFRTSPFVPRAGAPSGDALPVATSEHNASNADVTATILWNCPRDGHHAGRRRVQSGNRRALGGRRRMDDTTVGGRRTVPVE
jgi:hypothetical protein